MGKITGIILAGGKSSRMGTDKSLLPIDGKSMIEHIVLALRPFVAELLIVADDKGKYSFLEEVEFIEDIKKDQGPLVGMVSGLIAADNQQVFVTSCDMPMIEGKLIKYLMCESNKDIVSPFSEDGFEPMMTIYSKNILPYAQQAVERGERSINRFIATMDKKGYVGRIDKQEIIKRFGKDTFFNLNTIEDYNKMIEVYHGR